MNPEIILQKIGGSRIGVQDEGLERIDLLIQNPPDKFLGIAFDLSFKGGDYDHFDLATNLKVGDSEPPIYLAKTIKTDAGGKIVFGFTSKASDLVKLQNGVIGSFYFQDQPQSLAIENLIVSQFDGARKDLKDVKWSILNQVQDDNGISAEDLSALKAAALDGVTVPQENIVKRSETIAIDEVGEAELTSNLNATVETNLNEQLLADLLNGSENAQGGGGMPWWIILAVVLALGGGLYLLNRKFGLIRRRSRIRLLGRTFE